MASKFVCRCGEVVRTNLYEGHALRLLIPEEATDLSRQQLQEPAEQVVDALVSKSVVVAECPKCGAFALVDRQYNIKLYVPAN